MTIEEAKGWLNEGVSDDQLARIVSEWRTLKSIACHRFAIATGMDDWVDRFVDKMRDLQDANGERMVLVREMEAALLQMRQRLAGRPCRNCRGTGRIGRSTCVCCQGTKTFDM